MDTEALIAIAPFVALHVFSIVCMFKKFSENHYMAAIYNSSIAAKLISLIGMAGFWIYVSLCADLIRNSYNLEFNGWIGFAILAASAGALGTGSWGPEYDE